MVVGAGLALFAADDRAVVSWDLSCLPEWHIHLFPGAGPQRISRCTGASSWSGIHAGLCSSTERPGSINSHATAPTTISDPEMKNGKTGEPVRCQTAAKMIGESPPAKLPNMFIMPDTVPEYSPPTSITTAQAGPIFISRKNAATLSKITASTGLPVAAPGTRKTAVNAIAAAPTPLRDSLKFPVRLPMSSQSHPPTVSPIIPARKGMLLYIPVAINVKCRTSMKYVG